MQITAEELRSLIGKFANTDQLAQTGVTVAGTKYMYLSSTDKVIRAKKGTSGVHAIKTTQSEFKAFFFEPKIFDSLTQCLILQKNPI